MNTKLIKFGRRGCAPCAELDQALTAANIEHIAMDVEETPSAAAQYGIMSVPVIVHHGQKIIGGERCIAYVRSLAGAK
ncbi:hypothetical protein BLD48_05885 [Exiguobacterium sp. KRL4]|uniref:thioredoxin family protein n=1 Tax=Exiguobacterium sp. KRL4 TaxID=1914536 RepID=UPI0008F807AD|nr:thioredoxin family protein [Exiguobacterium sp. KRL4]OIN67416.1 hypothetical protein BLD48_05885 [Exiguobacterium sp. KRL4]